MKKNIFALLTLISLLTFSNAYGQGWIVAETENPTPLPQDDCYIPNYGSNDYWNLNNIANIDDDLMEVTDEYIGSYHYLTAEACDCGGYADLDTSTGFYDEDADETYWHDTEYNINISGKSDDSGVKTSWHYESYIDLVYVSVTYNVGETLCGQGLKGVSWHAYAFASIY